jgi:hypothetical protein
MKNNISKIFIALAAFALTSCSGWLSAPQPGKPLLDDFFIGGGGSAAIQVVNAVYVPLAWEYGTTYSSEWWIGDVASDDALKGGQNVSDMPQAYELDNFKVLENNEILQDWYQLNYQGIARCNFVLENIGKVVPDEIMSKELQKRLTGEVYFLRALYYFRLVRVFGATSKDVSVLPLITFTIKSSADWKQPKTTVDAIYKQIFSDLDSANLNLWTVDKLETSDIGRATKGAAQAMLLKAHLYYAQYDNSHFATAKQWGDSIINSGKYQLEPKYADNFDIYNENGIESVFETQYSEEGSSDYGSFGNNPHFGATRGTFTTILTRSRSTLIPKSPKGGLEGWGFNKPTQNLYDEFENGDIRRDASILNLTDAEMTTPTEEIYMGCRYLTRKYALMDENLNGVWSGHATRSPINIKLIRYADVLLLYAEACNESGDLAKAKQVLNELRFVRRAETADPATQLPDFPYGTYADNKEDLTKAIRHERRVELAMESHRWFDLVRWGIAAQTMNAYKQTESAEVKNAMSDFTAGRNEYFPLPQHEMDLGGFGQNDSWK